MPEQGRWRAHPAGFTLLELMISMALLAVMMAMAYSAFSTATSAVPRGEEAADRAARLRMATSLLTRQVRSMVNYTAFTDGEPHPFFVGDPSGFTFVTASPQLNGGEGLGWVRVWVEKVGDTYTLSLAERAIFSMRTVSGDGQDPSAQAVLLSGLRGVRFQYLQLDGTFSDWIDRWDPVEEQSLPGAIQVTIDGLGTGDSYWVQEIPVMTVVYGLGNYDPEAGLFEDLESAGESGESEE